MIAPTGDIGDCYDVVVAVRTMATPSASRQLPLEGAGYHKSHVVGTSFAAEGSPSG